MFVLSDSSKMTVIMNAIYISFLGLSRGSVTKNPSVNAGDTGDAGSIPRLGGSPGEGMATHSSILAWKIPWREEPDGLQSSLRVGRNLATEHTCT